MKELLQVDSDKSMIFRGLFDKLRFAMKCSDAIHNTDYESVGREFESLQARQLNKGVTVHSVTPFLFSYADLTRGAACLAASSILSSHFFSGQCPLLPTPSLTGVLKVH